VAGLKYVFVKIILCSGCPIYGTVVGLVDGAALGVIVKNIKFVALSEYLYLTAF
jgi:hypothetical protein